MMTPDNIKDAIVAAGLGWDLASARIVAANDATVGYVNQQNVAANLLAACQAGVMASTIASALADMVGGDGTNYAAILATGKSMRAELSSRDIAWNCPNGPMTVWSVGDRSSEVSAMYNGMATTTQAYYAAAGTGGYTQAQMAQGLADLVTGDSTLFNQIMAS